jgi:hypothetical protein
LAEKAIIDNDGADLLAELLALSATMLASHCSVEGAQKIIIAFIAECASKAALFKTFDVNFATVEAMMKAAKP